MDDELKSLFGEGSIDYATFEQKLSEAGIKLADLSKGGYVAKDKAERQQAKLQAEYDAYKAANDVSKYSDYDAIKKENDALKTEKAEREMFEAIAKNNVDEKFTKFVLSEVKGLVTKDKDFTTALKEYLEANDWVVKVQNPVFRKGNSSLDVSGKNSPNADSNTKMNNFLRGK